MALAYSISRLVCRMTRTMKITAGLNDLLLTRTKSRVAYGGVILTRFVEDALRTELAENDRPVPCFTLELGTIRGVSPPRRGQLGPRGA